jgi:hypothetical protein
MIRITTSLCALALLSGCGGDTNCLPKGEKGIVLRTGNAEGYRFATIRRSNGEEVTCTGKTTTVVLQEGDEIDGATLTRADATKKR